MSAAEYSLPTPDATAPVGSPEHRMWFIAGRPVCYQLVHGCSLTPPKPCVHCLRTPGHEGGCRMEWDYEDEYPEVRTDELNYQRERRAKDRFQVTRDLLDAPVSRPANG